MEIINSVTEETKILFYTLKVPNCCSETAEYSILLLFLLLRISFIQPTNKVQHIQNFNELSKIQSFPSVYQKTHYKLP